MEGGLEVEDGAPVLDADHAPGRVGAAVAYPVHLVDDGTRGVPGSEEVGVQAVDPLLGDRAPGGHERLAGDLTPEDALQARGRGLSAEQVPVDGLEVQG